MFKVSRKWNVFYIFRVFCQKEIDNFQYLDVKYWNVVLGSSVPVVKQRLKQA